MLKGRGLSITNLLLLNEVDGLQEDYVKENLSRVEELMGAGYLKIAPPEETLNFLTIPQLKEILRSNNQKVSGSKNELIERILSNIAVEKYSTYLPKIYMATEKGRNELETRWAYIENQRGNYGFLNSEIAALEETNSSEAILEKLFVRDIVKHGAAKDFGLLRNKYYDVHRFLKKRGRLVDSVTALLTALYFDFTGMGNNNTVGEYTNLNYAFETSLWSELDKERTALNLTDAELILLFDDAVSAAVKPPFSYFEIDIIKEMILARLHGQQNLLERYKEFSKKPREDSTEYNYVELNKSYNSADGEEIIKRLAAGEPPKRRGCAGLFLTITAAILLIFVI